VSSCHLYLKNVEGCGGNIHCCNESVVAEEMEKCMKSIEHSLLERKKGTMF